MADLRADRYIEAASRLGLELYRGVAELPIVSPHGHIDVRLLADPAARLDPPGRLFVTADHYVVRMLYSQGMPLERAGLGAGEIDDRAVWQLLADNLHLFALTPTGLWLRETLATVFGIEERARPGVGGGDLRADRGAARDARVRSAGPARPVPGRVPVDDRRRRLDARRASRARRRASRGSASGRPSVPTRSSRSTRAGWRGALSELEAAADREIGDYATFVDVLAERRAAFKALGATATDHAATSADTTRLADGEASALFAAALAGSVSERRRDGASRRTC